LESEKKSQFSIVRDCFIIRVIKGLRIDCRVFKKGTKSIFKVKPDRFSRGALWGVLEVLNGLLLSKSEKSFCIPYLT